MPKKKDQTNPESNPWVGRLRKMKRYQEAHSKTWKRNNALLFGKTDTGDSVKGQCSFGWGLVQSLITQVYVQNPEMMVEAYDEIQRSAGVLLSNIANFDIEQMDLKSLGNLGIEDAFVAGYAAMIETVQTEKEAKRFPGEEEGKAEDIEMPVTQQYITRRIPPKDILFDPQGTLLDLSDHRYIACAFYPTIQAIREDALLKKNLPEKLEDFPEASTYEKAGKGSSAEASSKPFTGAEDEQDPAFKTIQVWEIHSKIPTDDHPRGEIIYLTDHGYHELGRMDAPLDLQIGGRKFFPVTLLAFFPSASGFYPVPIIDLVAPQLAILNELNRTIWRDATSKWNKHATIEGLFTTEQLAQITDTGVENAVLTAGFDQIQTLAQGVQDHSLPPMGNLIVPIMEPQVKKDVAVTRDIVIQEITDILGFGMPSRGGMPSTRSAREAMAIKEKQDARLHRLLEAVTQFYNWFGQKHILIVQQSLDVERYVKVMPQDATQLPQWQKYVRDDIQGTFHFKVFSGTTMPRQTEVRRQQELSMFNVVAPVLMQAGYPIEPLILRLADVLQWKGVDQFFKNYKAAAKQLAMVLAALEQGQQLPPNVLPEAAAQSVRASLSDGELAQLRQQLSGQPQGGGVPAPKGQRGDSSAAGTTIGTI